MVFQEIPQALHSVPFVLGTVAGHGPIRVACPSAIPNALKRASHLWWSLLPSMERLAEIPPRMQTL